MSSRNAQILNEIRRLRENSTIHAKSHKNDCSYIYIHSDILWLCNMVEQLVKNDRSNTIDTIMEIKKPDAT